MKSTAALALCVLTLSVAGCTTSDDTPPGGSSSLAEEEGSDEEEGIPAEGEEETEAPGDEAQSTGEAHGGGDSASQTGTQDGSEQTSGPGQGEASNLPDPESMDDEVCVAFFEGSAPLAAQVLDARQLVTRGADEGLSEIEFKQVDVLAEVLDDLGSDASQEQAALITSINMPFTEVQLAADEGGQDAETGEVSYESVEMTESEEAQQEFTTSCSSSGSE